MAIVIGNSDYSAMTGDGSADLLGVKTDIAMMEARMKEGGYRVDVIKNSKDILGDVKEVMNKTPVASITHLQVLFSGESIVKHCC